MAIPILLLPPSACASGIIDSASIPSIAPAANDIAIEIVEGAVLDKKVNPITDEIVPMTTAIDHRETMYFLLLPLDFIPCAEDSPYGKFERKIAAISTMFTAPPVTKDFQECCP